MNVRGNLVRAGSYARSIARTRGTALLVIATVGIGALGFRFITEAERVEVTKLDQSLMPGLVGDGERALPGHVGWRDVEDGRWTPEQLREAGRILFAAPFTVEDGSGRPGTTGNASPTQRPVGSAPMFTRAAGPDANSCAGCHNQPYVGGAGDFVANVFVGPNAREPVVSRIDASAAAERGTPPMQGSGLIELLAREMTVDLQSIRDSTIGAARRSGVGVRAPLITKGVSFGFISADSSGVTRMSEIEGVDKDLVVRPWNQKGTVTSLRTFTINALNQHHGMQAVERFGLRYTGSHDFDRDGVGDEISEGDVTALVVYQATLNVPGRVLPRTTAARARIDSGERIFRALGCGSCHVPALPLKSTIFVEPGPYNLEGTLRTSDVHRPVRVDVATTGPKPHVELRNGSATVRAFTDLKRHRICDNESPHYCDETLQQGFASTDQFITARLWSVGNTPPYGHRGDVTTLMDAILFHGAEAREVRRRFEALGSNDQGAVVAFLRSLQILPEGSAPVLVAGGDNALPYARPVEPTAGRAP